MTTPTPPEIDLKLADQYARAAVEAFAKEFTDVAEEREAADGLRTLAKAYLEFRKGTLSTAPTETTDKIAELRSELHKTRIERDQARLEILPTGWYWDTAPGEVRARNIDGVTFCSPPVGSQLRAIGVIPPAVQMGVGLRAARLAVKPEPERWGVFLDDTESGSAEFGTLEKAHEYGRKNARTEYWVGPLIRAQASVFGLTASYICKKINDCRTKWLVGGHTGFGWVEGDLFTIRKGAQELLDVALDAMVESPYWTIEMRETNRHTVDTKPAEPVETNEPTDPPTCTGVGTASVS